VPPYLVIQHPEVHRLPGQHLAPVVPQAVQRADTDVAVEVDVEVEEQKALGPLQTLPTQHGPPDAPHRVQVPSVVEYVSQTAAGSLHFTVGEVLEVPQQDCPVSPQALHLAVALSHCVLAAVHLLPAQHGPSTPPQVVHVPATPVVAPWQTRSAVSHVLPVGEAEARQQGWVTLPQAQLPFVQVP